MERSHPGVWNPITLFGLPILVAIPAGAHAASVSPSAPVASDGAGAGMVFAIAILALLIVTGLAVKLHDRKRKLEDEVAAAAAIKAGVNMECGSGYKHALGAALEQGLISEDDLDAAVRPTLRLKMRLGLFEHPEQDAMVWEKLPAYDPTESRALARQV